VDEIRPKLLKALDAVGLSGGARQKCVEVGGSNSGLADLVLTHQIKTGSVLPVNDAKRRAPSNLRNPMKSSAKILMDLLRTSKD